MKRDDLISEIRSWKKSPPAERVYALCKELDSLRNRQGVGEAILAVCERVPTLDATMLNLYIREMPGFPDPVFASLARVPSSLAMTALFLGVGFPDTVPVEQKRRALEVFGGIKDRSDLKSAIRNDAKSYYQLTERKIAAANQTQPPPSVSEPEPEGPPEIISLKQLIDFLDRFQASDDEYENQEALEAAVTAWKALGKPDKAIAAMLKVFERFPESDALGNPGDLVRAIESSGDGYPRKLLASVKRTPSYYGVWMLHRILNAIESPREAAPLVKLLRSIAENESVPLSVRAMAEAFLEEDSED